MNGSTESKRPLDRSTADLARVCRLLEKRARSLSGLLDSHGFTSTNQGPLTKAAGLLRTAAETLEVVTITAPETEEDSRATLRGSLGAGLEWIGVGSKGRVDYEDPTRLTGNNFTVAVADFVSLLATLGKTGVLWVDTLEETYQIELSEGEVTYVSSNNPPPGERLGELLVRQGSLTEMQLHAFLGRCTGTPHMFGTALLRQKAITGEELRRALGRQMQNAFFRIFTAEVATYHFAAGVQIIADPELRKNATAMILECMVLAGDMAREQP